MLKVLQNGKRWMICVVCVAILMSLFSTVVFAAKLPFSDVNPKRWSYDYISTLYNAGIINGKSATRFEPESNITRAEFVKILGGVEKINPKKYSGSDFKDVSDNDWFSPYVKWAVKVGVTKGISANEFDPHGKITRQDMATMIYRYVQFRDIELNKNKSIKFSDSKQIAAYAITGVRMMQQGGIINGMRNADGSFRFEPLSNATREEASKILCILFELLKDKENQSDVSPTPNPAPEPEPEPEPEEPTVTQLTAFLVMRRWIIDNANQELAGNPAYYKEGVLEEEADYVIAYIQESNTILIGSYSFMTDIGAYIFCAFDINPMDDTSFWNFNYSTMDDVKLLESYGDIDASSFDPYEGVRFDICNGLFSDDADMIENGEIIASSIIDELIIYTNEEIIGNKINTSGFDMSFFGWDV